jgi:hypothetical protein
MRVNSQHCHGAEGKRLGDRCSFIVVQKDAASREELSEILKEIKIMRHGWNGIALSAASDGFAAFLFKQTSSM